MTRALVAGTVLATAEISKFGRDFGAAAVELGASTCAEGSSFDAGLPADGG